ncbi:unnamed protein product [Pylaiella littoralis]
MPADACSSTTYSEDEFELSLSGVSSMFGVGNDDDGTRQNTTIESHEEENGAQGGDTTGGAPMEPMTAVVVSNEKDDASSDDCAANASDAYSSFEEPSLPLLSLSLTGVGERDGRTSKQVC